MDMKKPLRKNVSAVILNKDKKVLMCEHVWIDGAWQFPQGGVEENETEEEALMRELKEELGTDKFYIIAKSKKLLKYKLPYYMVRRFNISGQEQRFFLVYFYGDDSEIKFDGEGENYKPEFKSFKWVDYDVPPLEVIYFKKVSYKSALDEFREIVENLDIEKLEVEIREKLDKKNHN